MKKLVVLALVPLLGCAAGGSIDSVGLSGGGSVNPSGSGSGAGTGSVGSGTGTGTGSGSETGTGTGSSGTASGSGGSTGTGVVGAAPLATGLSITEIAVFQGVKVDIVKGGAPATPNAPVVSGRRALVRVYVSPGAGFSQHAINGVLTLTTAGSPQTFTSNITPGFASTDSNWNSTFNFDVDAAAIANDTTFVVRLEDPNGSAPGDSTAQFPTSGQPTSLGAQTSGVVKISLFPIHFTNANAGTPGTAPADISSYAASVMSLYPATSVQITVEGAINYSGAVPDANGNGWSQLLNTMIQRRGSDPTPDVYYYGAFAPTSSFDNFCGQGCVAGLSSIPNSPNEHSQKASIGLVYGGNSENQQMTGETMAHEVGHGHGREHSPTTQSIQGCAQPSGIDPNYPYSEGDIGVWGYDVTSQKAYPPTQFFDVMGYCENNWISDYTYRALFNWMAADNGANVIESPTPTVYRQIIVNGDGSLSVGEAFPIYGVVAGAQHSVMYEDHGVTRMVTGFFYPYDHVPGGYLLAPEPAHFTSVSVPDFSPNATTP